MTQHFKVLLFWGELFLEKSLIHAQLTPMAKPKKPSVSSSNVVLIKVQIETTVDSHTGKTPTRWMTHRTKASRTAAYLLIAFSPHLP